MHTLSSPDAPASTASAAQPSPSASREPVTQPASPPVGPPADSSGEHNGREHIRHMLFGTLSGLRATIRHLHKLGYADPNDWSRPISTGRPNEVMAILTKRINSL